MTWTGQSFSVGQVLTAAQMNNLQADITAVMNQDSGAPAPTTDFISSSTQLAAGVVDTDELAAGAVQRAKIQTGTVTLSGTVAGNSTVGITMNAYAFFPMIHATQPGDGSTFVIGHVTDGASADNPRFTLAKSGAYSSSYDVDYRYIDA